MTRWLNMAWRNIWRTRARSSFLIATVALGCASLLLFACYIQATIAGLRESVVRGGTGHIQLAIRGQFDGVEEQQLQFGLIAEEQHRLERVLRGDDRVRRVAPRLAFGGLISTGQRTLTFQGTGVDPDLERQAFGQFVHVETGRMLTGAADDRYAAILGRELARRLDVRPGDNVTVMTSTVHGAINALDLRVQGTVSTGSPDADLYFLQLPLASGQELLRTRKVSRLIALLKSTDDTDGLAAAMRDRLGTSVEIRTWRQLNPIYEQVLALYATQFTVFGVIISSVVFLNVATITLTNVVERAREIGIMRSMGISAGSVRMLYACEGFLQACAGAMLGIATALVCIGLNRIADIRLPPPPGRNTPVPLMLLWANDSALLVTVTLVAIASCAAYLMSRRISLSRITKLVGGPA